MNFIRRTVVKALRDDSTAGHTATLRDLQKTDGPFIGRLKLMMVIYHFSMSHNK